LNNHQYQALRTKLELAQDKAGASSAAVEEFLLDLLSYETDCLEGCVRASAAISAAIDDANLDLELHAASQDEHGTQPPIVIGWLGPRTTSPRILLCAHVDTSPAGDGWHYNCRGERQNDYIFGRGAAVSKSDIAVFIHALKAARDALGTMPHSSAAVAITCDEGSGGDKGAAYLIGSLKMRPDLVVAAGFTEAITIAHNGCIQLVLRLTGTSCHQSQVPPRRDTLRLAAQICAHLYNYADELSLVQSSIPGLSHPTLNVTRISGGTVFGMAPSTAEIWIDRRVLPDEDIEVAQRELLSTIESASHSSDVTIEIDIVRIAKPMRPSEGIALIADVLRDEAYNAFGRRMETQGTTLYTDARWFSNANIPTVMYGAGEADVAASGANGIDERVPKAFLREATVVLARTLTRLLSDSE